MSRGGAIRSKPAGVVAVLSAIAVALAVAGCAKKPPPHPLPPPDADGTPHEAHVLRFGQYHPDAVDRARGDLDDWYRIEVSEPGTVRLVLEAPRQGALRSITLALTDPSGVAQTEPTRGGGRARVELTRGVERGTYLVWVGTEPQASGSGSAPYQITASFLARPPPKPPPVVRKPRPRPPPVEKPPPPPPPPPRIETLETPLVEVERPRDEGQFATIGGGERIGLRPGLRGRLVDGGRILGTFEIVEVYSGGSRVRIDGRLSGPVSGQTMAQVDVPSGP